MKITFNDIVAQLAHVGWGGLIALGFSLYMPSTEAYILTGAIAVTKESIESTIGLWEPVQTWPSSLVDMLFFGVGIGLAALIKL